jgi:hypothetical protein
MEKSARKPSQDPVQEKLRQDKSNWNKDVSLFINQVIHFKKLMNGAPNSFYKQKSKITEPIPANPTTIITSLVSDFQDLAQKGSAIVDEQLNYAKNHRPKQPKTAPLPGTPAPTVPPANDLSKQLAHFEEKYQLIAEGSNPLSRLKTRIFTRTRGISEVKRINRMRLDMLQSCNRARKALNKLQVEIVKGSKESITNSHKLMQQVWNDWAIVARSFSMYKNTLANKQDQANKSTELPNEETFTSKKETLPDQEPDEPSHGLQENSNAIEQVKNIVLDFTKYSPKLSQTDTATLETAINNYMKASRQFKDNAANIVINEYNNLLTHLNQLSGVSAASIEQAVNQVKPANPTEPLEATAQKFIKKWLGKKRHQYLSQNSSSYRLEVFELAGQTREQLNNIMDILEKTLDVEQLDPVISQINKQITNMRMILRSLNLSEKPDTTGLF